MAAKKKVAKKSSPKVKKTTYEKERDAFFKNHPNARYLLAILAVSFAFFVFQKARNVKIETEVLQTLDQEEEMINAKAIDLLASPTPEAK